MQHVDEALLIAYADNALEPAERATVDEHLAGCDACRARVEQERALARRADEVLAAVAPVATPVPPFENVLRRRNSGSSRARGSWMPLAWAASLVIAIGAGWMANELLLSPQMQAPQRAAESEAAAAPQAAALQSETASQPDAPPPSESATQTAPLPPAAAPQALALDEIVVRSGADAQQKAATPEARREAASGLAAVAYAPADVVVAMELDPGDVIWRGTSAEDAPLDGAPVRGVADVAIDSVWVASDSADWRARVLQRVDEAALEVIEWRRSPFQGVVASGTLPDGRRYLLGRSDSVLVELRARLDADALEALLERVRPLP